MSEYINRTISFKEDSIKDAEFICAVKDWPSHSFAIRELLKREAAKLRKKGAA